MKRKSLSKMMVMRRGKDLYCKDAKTEEFLGILRHTLGSCGESTGIFRGMETAYFDEIGYEELPSNSIKIPEGKFVVYTNNKWVNIPPHRMDVREQY